VNILEQKEIKQIHKVQEMVFYHISHINRYQEDSLEAAARVLPQELPLTHLDFIRPGHMVDCEALTNGMGRIAGAILPHIPQKALLLEPNLLSKLTRTQMYPHCFNGDVSFGLHYALELILKEGPYVFDANLASLPYRTPDYLKAVFINPKDIQQKYSLLPIL
jgi:hypothetical protein